MRRIEYVYYKPLLSRFSGNCAHVIVMCIFCSVYSQYLNLKTNRFVKKCMDDSDVNVNDNNLNVKISVSKNLN